MDFRMKHVTPLVYLLLTWAAFAAVPARADDAGLLELLQGEFALQEGDAAAASSAYVAAAEASKDPVLAERAAQIALLADDLPAAQRALARWRALQPGAPGLRPVEARVALLRGDRQAAGIALRELLADPEQWRGAVQALAGGGDSETAKAVLADLVRNDGLPDNLDAWLAMGGLAQRLGLAGLGPQLAAKVVVQFPDQPRAWLWLAEDAQRRKDPAAARAAIARAAKLEPLDASSRLAIAAQLDALGDPKAAAAALAVGAQDDTTLAGRAAYLARAEDDAALAELYAQAAAEADTASPARLYLLGQLAELQENHQAAFDWYNRVASGLQREQAQLRLAVIENELGKLDAALQRLRELQASDSEYGEILRDAYLLEAELLGRHERHEDALDAYARGLLVFEDDPELLYSRALTHERMDRLEAAEADLRHLIEIDPENADALNALGYTLADRTERYQEALELIQRAIKLKPDTPAIVDSLGWVHYRLGRIDDAVRHLRRAFELQRDAEVAAHLGEALWASGEREEARAVWRQGRELDPDNRALKQVLQRLDR
jgi:tetratricopeptide (TPR) repeat protein